MNKEAYEYNHDLVVYIPSVNSELSRRMNIDHWPKWLLHEILWFQFEGILEHTDFHARGNNIIFHSVLKLFNIFSIRICKYGGGNAEVICIKCKNCDRTVTCHLTSEEELNIIITPFVLH